MKDLISNNAKFVLDYGQYIIGVIILLLAYGIYRMVKNQKYFLPKKLWTWIASLISSFIIVVGIMAIIGLQVEKQTTGKVLEKFDTMVMENAPPLDFKTVLEDEISSLNHYMGRVVLFNLWATWCKPCLKEFPDLDKLQSTYGKDGFVIITLSDEKRERLLEWHEKNTYEFVSVYKENIDWLDIPIGTARPVTFLIDRNGIIKEYVTGARTYEFWEPKIKALLPLN